MECLTSSYQELKGKMSLEQLYFSGRNKVDEAIDRIQKHQPADEYILAFSGGKDSILLIDLAKKAGSKYVPHYCKTGIDPPELVYFIKGEHPEVIFIKPLMTKWEGILIHGLPLRQRRWCCQVLKEHDGNNRVVLQGVRWAESSRRRRRWDVYTLGRSDLGSKTKRTAIAFVSPIIDWTDEDVWQYIKQFNLPYCSLYDQGYKRIGCILCPFSSGDALRRDIEHYPKIVEAYRRAANRYIKRQQEESGVVKFKDGDEYFNWWIEERLGSKTSVPCGMREFEYEY